MRKWREITANLTCMLGYKFCMKILTVLSIRRVENSVNMAAGKFENACMMFSGRNTID